MQPKLMLCQDCGAVAPFDLDGHQEKYLCKCGGQWCGCDACAQEAEELTAARERQERIVNQNMCAFKLGEPMSPRRER